MYFSIKINNQNKQAGGNKQILILFQKNITNSTNIAVKYLNVNILYGPSAETTELKDFLKDAIIGVLEKAITGKVVGLIMLSSYKTLQCLMRDTHTLKIL